MSSEGERPVVVLTSGQMLKLQQVMLYKEDDVFLVSSLRAHAAKGFGPGGLANIGILGTPSLEFAAEVAGMMLLGGVIANAAYKTAVEFLQRARQQHDLISEQGIFFTDRHIGNMHKPDPAAWYALLEESEYEVDFAPLWKFERELLLQKHGKTARDIANGKLKLRGRRRYVHNGDEFIGVVTDVGQMSVRWSQIAAYRPAQ